MDIAKKRIMADMKNLRKNEELKKNGIHVKFNDDNIYNAQAMILGPADTPYEKGFYFFNINFPSDYPMNPPIVKFCTLYGSVRFNPNLYACGKVCLSIIGTWSGPGWTSCLTLSTVLVSIQSLLNENPITNEPGFEKEPITGNNASTYNSVIEYQNINVAVIRMLTNTPYIFSDFKPIMIEYFRQHYKFYHQFVLKHLDDNGKKFMTRIYSMHGKFEYTNLLNTLEDLAIKYDCHLEGPPQAPGVPETSPDSQAPGVPETSADSQAPGVPETSPDSQVSNSEQKKSTKKTPNEKASDFQVGHVIKSTNDNREYVVKKIIMNKKVSSGEIKKIEFNKWVLKK